MTSPIERLVNTLLDDIVTKQVEPKPLPILQHGMWLLGGSMAEGMSGTQKKALLVKAIELIAHGPDGIAGTTDDILPPIVVSGLKALIESQMLEAVIDLAHVAVNKSSCLKGVLGKCPCTKP